MFSFDILPLSFQAVEGALFIFALRLMDVSLITVRMISIMRGQRLWATLLSFVGITIWVIAISKVLNDLTNIWNILGYSSGFTTGTLVGMWLESKLVLGFEDVHIVSVSKGKEIAGKIRDVDYGATELAAYGQSGPVRLVNTVIPCRNLSDVIQLVNSVDAKSFITVEDTQRVMRGYRHLA